MSNLRLTTLATYRDYFKDIADKHVEINGFKWGNMKVVSNDNRSGNPDSFLWALPYENVRYTENSSDNNNKLKKARVVFLEVRKSELFTDEEEQCDRCEGIVEEIIARIMRDKRGQDVAGVWTLIATRIGGFTTGPAAHTIGSTPYLGWELEMEFFDNTNLAFNPERWSDTLTPP